MNKFDFLYEKDQLTKLIILDILITKSKIAPTGQITMSIHDLQCNLKISFGIILTLTTLKKRILALADDVTTLHYDNWIVVDGDGEWIKLNVKMADHYICLKQFYLKTSTKFRLLDRIIQHEDDHLIDFCEALHLSRTKINDMKSHLNQGITQLNQGIRIKNYKLVGEEKAIRDFLFALYFLCFNGAYVPVSERVINQANQNVVRINSTLQEPLSQVHVVAFRCYYAVAVLRLNLHHVIKDDLQLFVPQAYKCSQWIGPSINSLFTQDPFIPRLTGADLVNEIEWYMLFIMACDNNTKKIGKTVFLSPYYCELFQAISTTINRQFVLTFGNNYTKQQDVTTKLSDKFFTIVLRYVVRHSIGSTNVSDHSFDHINKSIDRHPICAIFLLNCLADLAQTIYPAHLHERENFLKATFSQLLYKTLTIIPISQFIQPINVYIDFSQGFMDNTHAARLLEEMGEYLNIYFVKDWQNEPIDVYISDMPDGDCFSSKNGVSVTVNQYFSDVDLTRIRQLLITVLGNKFWQQKVGLPK